MASQRSLTAGYVYPDAPRNYATDTNFVVGLTTNALAVGNVLDEIGDLPTTTKTASVTLPSSTTIISRLNYTIDGVPYATKLNVVGTAAGIDRVILDLRNQLLSKNPDNFALPLVMAFAENCLSVIDGGSGKVDISITYKQGAVAFEPLSIELIDAASPVAFV